MSAPIRTAMFSKFKGETMIPEMVRTSTWYTQADRVSNSMMIQISGI